MCLRTGWMSTDMVFTFKSDSLTEINKAEYKQYRECNTLLMHWRLKNFTTVNANYHGYAFQGLLYLYLSEINNHPPI